MPHSTGALLIHGLGGTEFDLGSLHKTLKRAGIETHSVTLPGHGTRPEDLVSVRAEDWMDAVTQEYARLACRYETLHVVGMCLGALLAIELCKRVRHRKGKLVSLAAPVYIDGWSTPWYRDLRRIVYRIPGLAARMRVEEEDPYGIKNELVRSIVKAKFERGESFHYPWVPLSCIREVDRVGAWVKKDLGQVACQTLIVHAHEDELTSVRSAHFLHGAIADSKLVLLNNSYHMVCVDNDRDLVTASVLEFMGRNPEAAVRPGRSAPMTAAEAQVLLDTYRTSMAQNEFETLFPLFSEEVVWQEEGNNPISGTYRGRGGLIEFFSRVMDFSRNTFSIREVGAVSTASRSFSMPLTFEIRLDSGPYEGTRTHTLRLRDKRIARVTSTAQDAAEQDSIWLGLASAHGATYADEHLDEDSRNIPAEDLDRLFEDAVAGQNLGAGPLPLVLGTRLWALEQQARLGNAPPAQEDATEVRTQIRQAVWHQLAGTSKDLARRRYIALTRRLNAYG
ncbi:esterase [Streptomyces cavourensis]|nr:esterase [Streptomyces cavourensis]